MTMFGESVFKEAVKLKAITVGPSSIRLVSYKK